MQNNTKLSILRYLAYVIEIILAYVLFSTPNLLPEIFGGKPTLLIVIAISISVFEREIPSMIFGLICGLCIDLGYSNSVGTFTILLTIICFVLGYVANNLFVANIWNVLLVSFIVVAGLFSLHFLFAYVMKEYSDPSYYFVHHYISRIVLTFIFTPLFYYLNKFIYSKLNEEE